MTEDTTSMFGSGVVVCLVKFHEHFGNREAELLQSAFQWKALDPIDREAILQDPQGNPGWDMLTAALSTGMHSVDELIEIWGMLWINGASDHLIDLDEEHAPDALITLRDELLEIRRYHTNPFTEEKWLLFFALVREAAEEIDRTLGSTPDWGDL